MRRRKARSNPVSKETVGWILAGGAVVVVGILLVRRSASAATPPLGMPLPTTLPTSTPRSTGSSSSGTGSTTPSSTVPVSPGSTPTNTSTVNGYAVQPFRYVDVGSLSQAQLNYAYTIVDKELNEMGYAESDRLMNIANFEGDYNVASGPTGGQTQGQFQAALFNKIDSVYRARRGLPQAS